MDRRQFCWMGLMTLLSIATGCDLREISRSPDEEPDEKRDQQEGPPLEKETMFYELMDRQEVRCQICFRRCVIPEGERGFCRNRENREGTLYNLVYGKPSALQVDPIEKEPMHHFLPGTSIFCVGTVGCNFRCKFCHNWQLSQRSLEELGHYTLSPEGIVETEVPRVGAPSISFTYNEPTSLYEYLYDTARLAQERDLNVIFHTNGSMSPEPLRRLLEFVDGVTVDLKGFNEDFYRDISQAELKPVLQTLEIIREEGVWLEVVNLVVPTLNDDMGNIRDMCRWIGRSLGTQVPLHFSRFFPSYRLTDLSPTPVETLERAHQVAREEGLEFVSIGNVPGHKHNSTFCPDCGETLIQRHHFTVHEINISGGLCQNCGREIPGVWK